MLNVLSFFLMIRKASEYATEVRLVSMLNVLSFFLIETAPEVNSSEF